MYEELEPIPIITLDPLPPDPFLNLCLVIIRQALRDRAKAKTAKQVRELERFFESPFYCLYVAYITSCFAELKYADMACFRPQMERTDETAVC